MKIYQNAKDSVLIDFGQGMTKVFKGQIIEVEEKSALEFISQGLFTKVELPKKTEELKEKQVKTKSKKKIKEEISDGN